MAPGPDLSGTFNPILRAAGIDRDSCLITWLFDDDLDPEEYSKRLNDPTERERVMTKIAKELEQFPPNCIVPLGAIVLEAFTGHSKIATFRGSVSMATAIRPGAKLLPTYHPEDVQKQWKFLSIATGDFVKAMKEADRGPKIQYPKKQILLEPSLDDLRRFATECYESDLLSTDIETGWGQITCIGFAPTPNRVMCVPFVDRRRPGRSYWPTPHHEVAAWKVVRDILQSPVPKVLQNGYYDASWCHKMPRIGIRNYRHDTRLMSHNLYPELPKDLATMSASYTDVGAYKQWGGKYQEEKRDA